jgi:hypothetical protein
MTGEISGADLQRNDGLAKQAFVAEDQALLVA